MSRPSHTAPRRSVLLVDDDNAALQTLAAVLEDAFLMTTAASGHDALPLLYKASFDVLVTDYQMPGMDGIELIKSALATERIIGAILITGMRDDFSRDARRGSATNVLYKPLDPQHLIDAVHDVCRAADMERAVSSFARKAKRL